MQVARHLRGRHYAPVLHVCSMLQNTYKPSYDGDPSFKAEEVVDINVEPEQAAQELVSTANTPLFRRTASRLWAIENVRMSGEASPGKAPGQSLERSSTIMSSPGERSDQEEHIPQAQTGFVYPSRSLLGDIQPSHATSPVESTLRGWPGESPVDPEAPSLIGSTERAAANLLARRARANDSNSHMVSPDRDTTTEPLGA